MTVARYADDAELNDELKERGHWNDPAAGFLRKKKAGRSVTGKALYTGAFQPNRYGIRPGHRWDGVDRGNGFESEWFKSRNRKANIEKLEYQWQQDE
jgi:pre-mRNA-splicing factor CWC26